MVAGIFLTAAIINLLADSFGAKKNYDSAFALVAYFLYAYVFGRNFPVASVTLVAGNAGRALRLVHSLSRNETYAGCARRKKHCLFYCIPCGNNSSNRCFDGSAWLHYSRKLYYAWRVLKIKNLQCNLFSSLWDWYDNSCCCLKKYFHCKGYKELT